MEILLALEWYYQVDIVSHPWLIFSGQEPGRFQRLLRLRSLVITIHFRDL